MAFVEKQRKLQPLSLNGSGPIAREIPRDTVIKGMNLRLTGAIQTTYGAGTPTARQDSIFNSLVSQILVICNGGRIVKSINPHLNRMQSLLNTGIQGERGSSAGASALATKPTVDGGFVFGTTGQYTTVAETLRVPFEFIWAKKEEERMLTWLDTRKLASCELRLIQNPFTSLNSQANTAVVTYANSTLAIDITLVEAVGVPEGTKFLDYRQTTKDIPFTAQANNSQIEINRGSYLAGLLFYCKDGSVGSASTATDRLASNELLTDITLKLNGSQDLKATTFKELQAENKARYGVLAPYAAGVSQLDGIAHMNFVENSIKDALNVTKADSLYLYVSTAPSSQVTYTNTAYLTIQTDEIAEISQ